MPPLLNILNKMNTKKAEEFIRSITQTAQGQEQYDYRAIVNKLIKEANKVLETVESGNYRFSTLEQLRIAIKENYHVYWASLAYEVIEVKEGMSGSVLYARCTMNNHLSPIEQSMIAECFEMSEDFFTMFLCKDTSGRGGVFEANLETLKKDYATDQDFIDWAEYAEIGESYNDFPCGQALKVTRIK